MIILQLYAKLKKDINYIEDELAKTIQSDHQVLHETSAHLLKAGGKRIRPVFVLLSGKFGNYSLINLSYVAVSLELIHMATLVHDDVIDDAEKRRGQLTVKSKWDNRIAMYTGDYIFAKALQHITELKNPLIHKILSKAIVEMCIGEMEQIRFFFKVNQTVRDYLLRIRRKTALLIAVSCQLGALAAEVPEKVSRSLYAFGYNVGMAFQIRDDILDLCGTEKELGKPPGSDIKQGNITLPVILSLRDPLLQKAILEEIERIEKGVGEKDISVFLQLIDQGNGLKLAEDMANRYIDKAIEALSPLTDNHAKKNLIDIAYFVGNRSY